jgi:3-oxo-5,6-didehydrosuberyl-CoA/3-oxoadipyl-CoA thiolase
MSRAPFVMGKATAAFQRQAEIFDTTIGWRFVNPLMHQQFGTDSMPETAENVAELLNISRADQDALRCAASSVPRRRSRTAFWRRKSCRYGCRAKKGRSPNSAWMNIRADTTLEQLAGLKTPFRKNGVVTAGNASGVNDGAAALIIASEKMALAQG